MQDDSQTTLADLKQLVAQFRDERGWEKHHTPRNLATSISIEAAELLELFQWSESTDDKRSEIADELSDVLIYCFNLADTLDIDIASSFRDKLQRSAVKYPTELFNPDTDGLANGSYVKIKRDSRGNSQGDQSA